MARRLIVIAAAAAALALPTTASALNTPQFYPLPASVLAGPVTISWTPVYFNPFYPENEYLLTVAEHPLGAGTATYRTFATDERSLTVDVHGLSRTAFSIRAVQWTTAWPGLSEWSQSDVAVTTVWPRPSDPPVKG
jgi:hypothetical protein